MSNKLAIVRKELIKAGADPNIILNKDAGTTLLMFAAANILENLVQFLISAGVTLNQENEFGHKALTYAVVNGHLEVVKQLIDAGADLNAQGKQGKTALIFAIDYGHSNIAALLIKR